MLDDKTLGLRIRAARTKNGKSQTDFANELGLSQRAISEIENGDRSVKAIELLRIAQKLNVSIIYFFDDEDLLHDVAASMSTQLLRLEDPRDKLTALELVRTFCEAIERKSAE